MEITKNKEGFKQLKNNSNVSRKIIHLENLMMTVIEITGGPMAEPEVPHQHPHEQITYVAKGSLKVFIEDREYLLTEGDTFKVAPNLKHGSQTLTEYVKLIDTFSPIRDEFLS